jgi:hypothetical protein
MHVIDFPLIYITKSFQSTPILITPVRPGTHPWRKSRATCILSTWRTSVTNFIEFCRHESSNIWNNINIYFEETGLEDVTWNHLNQKKIQCWALVNMVKKNLWSPCKSGNFSITRVSIASQELCSKLVVQKKAVFKIIFQTFLPNRGAVANAFTWYTDDITFWITRVIAISQWKNSMSQQSNTGVITYNTTTMSSLHIYS